MNSWITVVLVLLILLSWLWRLSSVLSLSVWQLLKLMYRPRNMSLFGNRIEVKVFHVGINWFVGIKLHGTTYAQAGPYSGRSAAADEAAKWSVAWNAQIGTSNEDVDRVLDRISRNSGQPGSDQELS